MVYVSAVDISSVNNYSGGVLSLIYASGPVAKVVLSILFMFSIVSWTIILYNLSNMVEQKKIRKDL